jgi:bifunctional DNA-binding transcriptional regulator/antitoxin component of YhaV-PrlF toxin-antitoxin module
MGRPTGRITRPQRFRSQLVRPVGVGTWTFAVVSPKAIKEAGLRARMRVSGTIDGVPFRSSLMPRGKGILFVVVPQPIRDRIGKSAGDSVELSVAADLKPVVLRVPPDFRRALGNERPRFDALAPSHRKAFLDWIEGAKQAETRARRITQAVDMVRRGQNRN